MKAINQTAGDHAVQNAAIDSVQVIASAKQSERYAKIWATVSGIAAVISAIAAVIALLKK